MEIHGFNESYYKTETNVKEQSVQCSIEYSISPNSSRNPPRFNVKSRIKNLTPRPILWSYDKSITNINLNSILKKYSSPVHLTPHYLMSRSSILAKKPERLVSSNNRISCNNKTRDKDKEKSVMEYYRELLGKPSKPFRTRHNFHKEVSCVKGYRTKLQKDPKIMKNIFGDYSYADPYVADAKRQMKAIMSLN
ncbi:hypothetical protein SteCoe_2238 [Stentor coeruleus]|uniref:Uncharacterized protein n=1 Tax=Stentor coeruleus TaxID=5963 RepID=A0A1R2D044_9CILI|nr:hypothetical protein SteCoe_2238 [Stentor coeruleus]